MKVLFTPRVFQMALVLGLGWTTLNQSAAQTFKNLHNFDNSDGIHADQRLALSKHTLYGVTGLNGAFGLGTIFSVKTDWTAFTVLHDFSRTNDAPATNTDGSYPLGGMVLSGNTLYGTTSQGGIWGVGTVFRINTDGTGFTNLHSFTLPSNVWPRYTNDDGAYPVGDLVLSGETLYGVAPRGGALGNGAVFAVSTTGTGFTNLYSFGDNEAANVAAGLILGGDTLYGTAAEGGSAHNGTLFKLNTNGTGFTILHTFSATPGPFPYTNSDGASPDGALVLNNNRLFGATYTGGDSGYGTIYSINTDGSGFTNLHVFSTASSAETFQTNSEGAFPQAGMTVFGNTLFGTATGGGIFGAGTIFAINTDGSGFVALHHFPRGEDAPVNLHLNDEGSFPRAELIFSDHTLYGTAGEGGTMGLGTAFALSLLPQLTVATSGNEVVLTWPTNVISFTNGFTLESATNLTPPVVWTPASPAPSTANGINAVTNSVSAPQMFYRLRQ